MSSKNIQTSSATQPTKGSSRPLVCRQKRDLLVKISNRLEAKALDKENRPQITGHPLKADKSDVSWAIVSACCAQFLHYFLDSQWLTKPCCNGVKWRFCGGLLVRFPHDFLKVTLQTRLGSPDLPWESEKTIPELIVGLKIFPGSPFQTVFNTT